METNETLKRALLHETEQEMLKMIEQVERIPAGDLQTLEQSVLRTCLCLGRTMMEQILTHTAKEAERPSRREGECGQKPRLVGLRPKQLHTLMGKVTIGRAYYQCVGEEEEASPPCGHGQAPWDAVWGLRAGRTSPGVQKLLGKLVSRLTLCEAVDTFTSILPLPMSERQALNLIQPLGEALREQEEERVQALFEQAANTETHPAEPGAVPGPSIRRLYVETDGVMARIRRGSVSMEEAEVKRKTDFYREIKVGAVFEGIPGRERSDLVPGVFLDEAGPLTTYVAQRLKVEEFGRFLYALAHRCGVDQAQEVVILGDGARWIRPVVEDHFPHAVQIVDLYHAREHLWTVANAVHGAGTPQRAAWAKQGDELLSQGQIEDLVAFIEKLPAIAPEPGAARSLPDSEANYFLSNAARMRYPAFRAKGMHIGSGVAEAACKTVVSTRAKRSGMRWTPHGLDALLALRTAVLNGTYDEFWQGRLHLVA